MIPTGNPNIPYAVHEAKEICELIVEKAEGSNGSEDELFSTDDVEEIEEEAAEIVHEEEEEVGNENVGDGEEKCS
jgi:vacuolar-type H+-ATPase subunit H